MKAWKLVRVCGKSPESPFLGWCRGCFHFAPLIEYPTVDPVAFATILPGTRLATLDWEFGYFHFSFWHDSLQHSILGWVSLAHLENLNWQDAELWIFPDFLSKTLQIARNVSHQTGLHSIPPWPSGQPTPFYQVCLVLKVSSLYSNPVSGNHLSFGKRNEGMCGL